MGLRDDLTAEVKKIFQTSWQPPVDGRVVPDDDDLSLSNVAKKFDGAVVFYADMSYSTKLVDEKSWTFAAEIYKTFLHCAAKLIRSEDGNITAYDGDRIMAIYVGERKHSRAAITALKLNYARQMIINPLLKAQYPDANYEAKHVVGIDKSILYAAKTGVRGDNDLVWVGRAANHAAKLSSLSTDVPSWITAEVYDQLAEDAKLSDGKPMWEKRTWAAMNRDVYCSTWRWGFT